jgi:hypothetical protein
MLTVKQHYIFLSTMEFTEASRMPPYYGPAGEPASEIALERMLLASGFNTNVDCERVYSPDRRLPRRRDWIWYVI